MENTVRQLIEEYLSEARLMQVATVSGDQPWACSVYFAYDGNLRLYWISKPDRRHSLEIDANEKVAGTVVLPHTPGDDVRGIQFEGTARKLTDPEEISSAMACYAKRYGMGKERVDAIVNDTDGHMCYVVIPRRYVLFDEVHFPDEPRQEFTIEPADQS